MVLMMIKTILFILLFAFTANAQTISPEDELKCNEEKILKYSKERVCISNPDYMTEAEAIIKEAGDDKDQLYVSLETAHPAKFPEEITRLLDIDPELPKSLEGIEAKEEQFDTIPTTYEDFKAYLLKNYK